MSCGRYAIAIHGGGIHGGAARELRTSRDETKHVMAMKEGLSLSLQAGLGVLQQGGGSALDAVQAAILVTGALPAADTLPASHWGPACILVGACLQGTPACVISQGASLPACSSWRS
jgi:hypothetical protein